MGNAIPLDIANMQRPVSVASAAWADEAPLVPNISDSDTFTELLDKLSLYVFIQHGFGSPRL